MLSSGPNGTSKLASKALRAFKLRWTYLGCTQVCAQAIMGHDCGLTDGIRPGRCKGIGRPNSCHIGARRLEPPALGALQGAS
jgi:hypothetical protein